MSARVLVDGAGGFVGRHVVHELQRLGHRVRATDRPGVPLSFGDDVERVEADLLTDDLDPLLVGVDRVVHVAGLFDLSAPLGRLFNVNVHAARRIVDAAAHAGVRRLVHVSSVTVYGRPRRPPAREDAKHRPGNDYERSKAAGEVAVREVAEDRGVPLVIVRPSGVYGPGGRYGLAMLFATYALAAERGGSGSLVAFRGGPRMTHVHVADVAGAIGHLLDAPDVTGRAFNVADKTPMPWGDLMALLEEAFEVDAGPPKPLTPTRAKLIAHAWRWLPEGRRAKLTRSLERRWRALVEARDLAPALAPRLDRHAYDYWLGEHIYDVGALEGTGYRLRYPNLRIGLKETLAWYREHRWLPGLIPA